MHFLVQRYYILEKWDDRLTDGEKEESKNPPLYGERGGLEVDH